MASTSAINYVRIFFYAQNTIVPERRQKLVALAYAAARKLTVAPTAILIRLILNSSDLHRTTLVKGQVMKDKWHGTFSFKDKNQEKRNCHVTTHGYTEGRDDFILKEAIHMPEKPDDTIKADGKVVWPAENKMEEYEDSPIGYCHLSQDEFSTPK
ncbi:hypothetical protein E4U53_001800 [Claviceps sorghi]|nr:hypothetical protein E4U53_001800 [Claviceps sorghi]